MLDQIMDMQKIANNPTTLNIICYLIACYRQNQTRLFIIEVLKQLPKIFPASNSYDPSSILSQPTENEFAKSTRQLYPG